MLFLRKSIVAASTICCVSCNHLFYHPDSVSYGRPDQLGMEWQEHYIVSGQNRLHVWEIPAKLKKPFGSLIHFHGNAQNMSAHLMFSFWLHYFGFNLILFDYSGYGKSEGTPDRDQTVMDGRSVLNWASKRIEPPLYILGQSLGGAIAITSLASDTRLYTGDGSIRAIALDSTFASYRNLARKKLSEIWLTWPLQFPLSLLISDKHSPARVMNRIYLPTLAFHSFDDPVVPYSEGVTLYNGLGTPAKIENIEQDGHTLAFAIRNTSFRETMIRFLCQNSNNEKQCLQNLEANRKFLNLQVAMKAGTEILHFNREFN